jgi:Squalene-hopene cyclase C-terminal domain
MIELPPLRFPITIQAASSSFADLLIRELRCVINDLGRDGGLVNPSVYDTAQRLRLAPAVDSLEVTLTWLMQQQKADGGWGDPVMSAYRDIPTMASILALQQYAEFSGATEALQAGLDFLKKHAYHWHLENLDMLPVAAELIVPHLLEECHAIGLSVPVEPYAELILLENYKRKKLKQILIQHPPKAGASVLYCWEVWGTNPDPALIDQLGSCGTSPAATAAWLRAAVAKPNLAMVCDKVLDFLNQSAATTKTGVPGVISTVWPIEGFESYWSLEALLLTGLLHHPALKEAVLSQARAIANMMQPGGWGFSTQFVPDADDTATAMAVLYATGLPVNISILKKYEKDGVFVTYAGERNPSVSATARGIRVLAMMSEPASQTSIKTLLSFRSADGRWRCKWHSSWLYTTLQCLLALLQVDYHEDLDTTIGAYLSYQNPDGGWGEGGRSTAEETAYAIIALLNLEHFELLSKNHEIALQRGFYWLLKHYNPCQLSQEAFYISKELYGGYRLNHAYILSAMLAVALKNQ